MIGFPKIKSSALGRWGVGLAATVLAMAALSANPLWAEPEAPEPRPSSTATAIFAGGCFWCLEKPFDQLDGVLSTTSGYTGGQVENPSYEQVSKGGTGHVEAVRVEYDPSRVTYEKLLAVFWRNIDPVDGSGQFCDRGFHYTSAIFPTGADQERSARASKAELTGSGKLPAPIATRVIPAGPFYDAEEYHQNYYEKNPIRYRYYRYGCGRDKRLEELWGKPQPKP